MRNLLFEAAQADTLSIVTVGRLMGDPRIPSNTPGQQAERLIAAAAEGKLKLSGSGPDGYEHVTRSDLARWLTAYGSQSDRNGIAMNWARGIGRVEPAKPTAPAPQPQASPARHFAAAPSPSPTPSPSPSPSKIDARNPLAPMYLRGGVVRIAPK